MKNLSNKCNQGGPTIKFFSMVLKLEKNGPDFLKFQSIPTFAIETSDDRKQLQCLNKAVWTFFLEFKNRTFPSSPWPVYQNEVCSAFDMEINFQIHSNANFAYTKSKKTHLCTRPHFESQCFWMSEVAY